LAGGTVVMVEPLIEFNPSNLPVPLSVRLTDRGEASQGQP